MVNVESLADAVAEGARSTGATVDVRRVPETAPEKVAKAAYFKLDQRAPVATVAELADRPCAPFHEWPAAGVE